MFKVNSRNTKCRSGVFIFDCGTLLFGAFLLLLLLLLTSSMLMADGILSPWSKSMHFRVRSRNPVIITTKLYVTTINNSFQPLPNFCHKELHRRCCVGLELNIGLNGLKRVNINSLTSNSIFSKGGKPFDYIKRNIIPKLAY